MLSAPHRLHPCQFPLATTLQSHKNDKKLCARKVDKPDHYKHWGVCSCERVCKDSSVQVSRPVTTDERDLDGIVTSLQMHSTECEDSTYEICPVTEKGKTAWMNHGHGKVTIDSGAEESVWPKGLLEAERVVPAKNPRKFVAANGNPFKTLRREGR